MSKSFLRHAEFRHQQQRFNLLQWLNSKFCLGDVMVAMMVLEAIVERRGSSSLPPGTILKHTVVGK
jgi:hypothetical protein